MYSYVAIRATRLTHLVLLDFIALIIFDEQQLTIMYPPSVPCYFLRFRSKHSPQRPVLKENPDFMFFRV